MLTGICINIGDAALGLGLLGLILDLCGASLIVAVDISRFDFLWQDDKRIEKAKTLQKARKKLFQENAIEEGDVGFDLAKDVILEESETDRDPTRLHAQPPGTLGGGGNVFITDDEGEYRESVGSHNLVDGWLQREIEDLDEGFRDRYRRFGMWFLLIGFTGQIISYLLRNFNWLSEFLVESFPC